MWTDFVLDALERASYARQPELDDYLVCYFGRGSQYVSTRNTERLCTLVLTLAMFVLRTLGMYAVPPSEDTSGMSR